MNRWKPARAIVAPCLVVGVAACGGSTAPGVGFCTAPASIAIELGVRDSATGAPLADSAMGTVSTTSYQDSLHHVAGVDSLLIGGNQLGSYTIVVRHRGYLDWNTTGVVVSRQGVCGNVVPVELAALLVRAP